MLRSWTTTALFVCAGVLATSGSAQAQTVPVAEQELSAGTNPNEFGGAVDVQGDRAIVGARGDKAVYVYARVGTTWTLQQRLESPAGTSVMPEDTFGGGGVGISGDTLVVGAPGSNSAYVFTWNGTTWGSHQRLTNPNEPPTGGSLFGESVDIDGNVIVVGAPLATAGGVTGAAYVFERSGATWVPAPLTRPTPDGGQFFGNFVAVSGDTACVGDNFFGSPDTGAAYLFGRSGATWVLQQRVTPPTGDPARFFGACAVHGDTAVVGTQSSDAAFVFTRTGSTWSLQQRLSSGAPNDFFGGAVAIAGNSVVVGAQNASGKNGRAYFFGRTGTVWTKHADYVIPASPTEHNFGAAAAFDGTTMFVGAPCVRSVCPGRAHVYRIPGAGTGAPGAPDNLQATATGNNLLMTWQAPATGATPTNYTLLARTAAGAAPLTSVPLDSRTSFAAAAPNGTFLLSLNATNAYGTGPESAATTVTFPGGGPAAPAPPSALSANVAGNTATFAWTAAASGGPPAGYVLQAGTTPGFTTTLATLPVPVSPTTYAVTNVPAGTYYVRLVAQNTGGTSGPSNEVTVTVAGAAAPGAPTLAATATGSTVNVSWTAGSGGTPTGYTLRASTTPGGAPIATLPVSGTSAAFTDVPSGTYYLTLTASNATGTSPASNQVTVTVP